MSNGGKGGVYDQSAAALQGAGNAYTQAQNMYANSVPTGQAATYNPATGQAVYAADPSKIAPGIPTYMNPYTDEVIDRSVADIQRLTNQQLDQTGATAAKSGAFGGSRHGLVESTVMSEAQKNMGDLAANLRNNAFGQAASLAGQDVANTMNMGQFNANQGQNMNLANMDAVNTAGQWNSGAKNQWAQNLASLAQGAAAGIGNLAGGAANLGQTGFNIGQSINSNQMNQGTMQQALIQSIMDLAGGQTQGFTNQPQNILQMALSALGMNPMSGATTTTGTYNPGWLDYLSLGAQAAGATR